MKTVIWAGCADAAAFPDLEDVPIDPNSWGSRKIAAIAANAMALCKRKSLNWRPLNVVGVEDGKVFEHYVWNGEKIEIH